MMCHENGVMQYRSYWTMTDKEIAKLSLPELVELIKRLLEEVELRYMQLI